MPTLNAPRPGHALLALLLGLALSAGAAAGTPLEQALEAYEAGRLEQAARGFAQLSHQGLPLADYNLAMMHIRGELPKPDLAEARRLLERAAAHKLVRALLALGQWHEQGLAGKPDLRRAVHWWGLAAAQGSVDGQVQLATAYYLGRGLPQDMGQAAHWYREAAKNGDVGAQYLIASMYESGLGVDRDLRLARYWYDIAARNGDEAAPAKLKELDARLQGA